MLTRMFLTKRKQKQGGFTYYIVYKDPETRTIRKKSTGTHLISEANRQLVNFALHHRSINASRNRKLDLKYLFDQVLEYVKVNLPKSYLHYLEVSKKFIGIIGNMEFQDLRAEHIEIYKAKRSVQFSKYNPGVYVSPVTVNKELRTIKATISKAMNELRIVYSNPFEKTKLIKVSKRRRTIKRFTRREIDLIMGAEFPEGAVERAIIIARNTGMRLEEICCLQWKDVDINRRVVWIRNKPDIDFFTKWDSEGMIPINGELYNKFIQWKYENGSGKILNIDGGDGDQEIFIIARKDGAKYKKRTICRKVTKFIRKLGMVGGLHKLRHTFASELLEGGADIKTVQELMRHSNIETTEIYLSVMEETKIAAVNLLTSN